MANIFLSQLIIKIQCRECLNEMKINCIYVHLVYIEYSCQMKITTERETNVIINLNSNKNMFTIKLYNINNYSVLVL